ncbi:hypothetical protein [Pseudomonas sp.]|jgi:hypothetical protein|uniref:hypothetical protein n=1 Tax=Pseudomonas sp. TaxID=306 RepID=UPI002E32D781|nr:hypothetical protein [Pseudomonas sp.]HEX4550529.1 hypothetical protein [Pseudomonas sp.]
MSTFKNSEHIGVLAVPLSIEGVGADGVLPEAASTDGARLLIPLWQDPSVTPGKSDLLEIWVTVPDATVEELFYSNSFPVPVAAGYPGVFLLPARFLQRDGNIILRYRITLGDNGNEDTSLPQTFIVRRQVPINLAEPTFPHATPWGYLNCGSTPKLWEAVWVDVPTQRGRFLANDVCVLEWEGFFTNNGKIAIPLTKLEINKILTPEEADNGPVFILGSDKYERYIKPMENDASALARYTLYRNGIALGRSPFGLVKIDRTNPGTNLLCGPASVAGLDANDKDAMALNETDSAEALVPETCRLPSHASSLDNNVDSSMKHSPMELSKMNMQFNAGGVLAEPPVIKDQLPDKRLTYKQLREDRSLTVTLEKIDEDDPSVVVKVDLHIFPKGTPFNEFDPTFIVASKLLIDQPGGAWSFPIVFDDVPVTTLIEKFNSAGDYTAYEAAFVITDVFDNTDSTKPPIELLVDLTAPYQRQPGGPNGTGTRPPLLTLGATVPSIINDAWLNDPANAGGLNLEIPHAYQKFEPGLDQCLFFISQLTTFTLMSGETPAFAGPLPATGIINIPLSFLSGLPEGTYYYSYNLTDAPGNISNNAAITTLFQRVVTPAPILAAPRIPVTGADGRIAINLTTVNPPPTKAIMEIDFPLNSIPGDRIIPYLSSDAGIFPLPELPIPPAGTAGPLLFDLDYTTLADVFGDVNNPDELEFEYWYELSRPTIPSNPVSPSAFGVIDFAYAGPEQPNLPDLENPNILNVVVQGAGTPAPAPNTLTPAQAGLDAVMNWPVWTDPNRPVTGREIVKFYYQGKQVGEPVPVRVGDTTVTTRLPWPTILAEGNGTGADARKAYITVEYPGSANVMKQLAPTNVNVTAIVINLPAPQIVVSAFRGPTGTLVPERVTTTINCPSFNHPSVANGPMPPYLPRQLRIRVRRDANIPTGAVVNLDFEGRTTNAVGAPAIPGTHLTRSAPMPPTGDLEFRLTEYAPQIRTIQLPSPNGTTRPTGRYARIAYTVNGVTAEVTVAVQLLNASLVYCEEERPEVTP